jgi:phosphoribosylaminoimidazole-succinocarboxamide synthase
MSMHKIYSGKVRDIYDAGDEQLLMVSSDRISALDAILPQPIPEKGRVLTGLTVFWLRMMSDIAPNHLITANPDDFPSDAKDMSDIAGRAMLVKKAEMIPLECIVRGYLSGSAFKEYQQTQSMHGQPLSAGMLESQKLPKPVFTPSTKAEIGAHDQNISFDDACYLVGRETAEEARRICLAVYERGAHHAAQRGIIIADTKFELGIIDGQIAICDEVLTPDSSRFWPADQWQPGKTPPSFDKQPVRDWLSSTGWKLGDPTIPDMPDDVVKATIDRYITAYETLTGSSLTTWYGADHR